MHMVQPVSGVDHNQCFGSEFILSPDPDPAEKNIELFLIKKLQFTYYPQDFIKDIQSCRKKPSALKREHPALQKFKTFISSLFLWVIFALLDPDPDLKH